MAAFSCYLELVLQTIADANSAGPRTAGDSLAYA